MGQRSKQPCLSGPSELSLLKADFEILWLIFRTPGTSSYKQKHKSTSAAKRFLDSLPFTHRAPSTLPHLPISVDSQEVTARNDLQGLLDTM